MAGTLEEAVGALARRRRRAVQSACLAGVCGGLAVVASAVWPSLALPFAVASPIEAVLAVHCVLDRRDLVGRLALDPAAYTIPEVARYGERRARPAERERLAHWIGEVLADAFLPGSFYLADRIAAYGQELASLAREFGSPGACVEPASAVACLRLLSCAAESPLYNERVPAEDLRSILYRIRAGIRYAPDEPTLPTRRA